MTSTISYGGGDMKQWRNTGYYVTSCGKVWSTKTNKWLSLIDNSYGYKYVNLYIDSKLVKKYVHIMVAECYIPNPNNLPQVNHKDEVHDHNYVNNLEWCDQKYNNNYSNLPKRASNANKLKNSKPIAKIDFTSNKILNVYNSAKEASRKTGIPSNGIINVANNKPRYKSAGGYKWRYLTEQEVDLWKTGLLI